MGSLLSLLAIEVCFAAPGAEPPPVLGDSLLREAELAGLGSDAAAVLYSSDSEGEVERVDLQTRQGARLHLRGLHRCTPMQEPWPEEVRVHPYPAGPATEPSTLVLTSGDAAVAITELRAGQVLTQHTLQEGGVTVRETLILTGTSSIALRRGSDEAVVCAR